MSDFLLQISDQEELGDYLKASFDLADSGKRYIVANTADSAEVHASEVDRFIRLSKSTPKKKAEAIKIIYEKEAILFDDSLLSATTKVIYDQQTCQFANCQSHMSPHCVSICPVQSITKLDGVNQLNFDASTCIGCGSCVAVCPANAIEMSEITLSTLEKILPLYEDTIPLIVSRADFDLIDFPLPAGVVPLCFNTAGFMSEAELLGVLQSSGSQAVIYKEKINTAQSNAIKLINEMSTKAYGKPAIFWASTPDQLKITLADISLIAGARANISSGFATKRERFNARLKLLINDQDFGVISDETTKLYGKVAVDESTCTLCMGCVAVCKTGALFVRENALMGDFANCTQCGECVYICPEKSMSLVASGIALNSSHFEETKLATDEEFNCVECGKPFATHKSIMKIVAMMEPLFAHDPIKARTLRCCADCKPKLMLKESMKEMA